MNMKNRIIKQSLILGLSLSAVLLTATSAIASGSMPSARVPTASTQSGSQTNNYDLGKAVYMEKISCSTCPVAGGVNDAAGAKGLIARVNANEFKLSSSEKRRLKTFLNRRFDSQ
jgi:hypothetical protein